MKCINNIRIGFWEGNPKISGSSSFLTWTRTSRGKTRAQMAERRPSQRVAQAGTPRLFTRVKILKNSPKHKLTGKYQTFLSESYKIVRVAFSFICLSVFMFIIYHIVPLYFIWYFRSLLRRRDYASRDKGGWRWAPGCGWGVGGVYLARCGRVSWRRVCQILGNTKLPNRVWGRFNCSVAYSQIMTHVRHFNDLLERFAQPRSQRLGTHTSKMTRG